MSQGEKDVLRFRIVLDVLKPHEPSIVELARMLVSISGVEKVSISVQEIDVKTETVKVVIEGVGFPYDKLLKVIEDAGAAVHSIDEIVVSRVSKRQGT